MIINNGILLFELVFIKRRSCDKRFSKLNVSYCLIFRDETKSAISSCRECIFFASPVASSAGYKPLPFVFMMICVCGLLTFRFVPLGLQIFTLHANISSCGPAMCPAHYHLRLAVRSIMSITFVLCRISLLKFLT